MSAAMAERVAPAPPVPADQTRAGRSARLLVAAAILLVPLRIVGYGYLPTDDALRHAAKAVSGRPWSEILVLRPDMALDAHAGWHAILGAVRAATGADAHALVLFSVVVLFVAVSLGPLLLLRRPEAWALSLLVFAVFEPMALVRLVQARPLLVSAAVLVLLCLRWKTLTRPRAAVPWAVMTALFAAATWIHGSWFLFLLPVAVFALAGERRLAARLLGSLVLGALIGASLTGHPFGFLAQSLRHTWLAFGSSLPTTSMAVEFQPFSGSPLAVAAVAGLLGLRALRGRWHSSVLSSPVFLLMVAGWVLGFFSVRFWADWGLVAAMVFVALELQDLLEQELPHRRLAAAAAASAVAVLALSSNVQGRWSGDGLPSYLGPLMASEPAHAPWLPEPGGIFYCADMRLFFQTFYRNPQAPWRYVVGFEPGLMLPEDHAVFRAFMSGRGRPDALQAWVAKMRPADRLLLVHSGDTAPPVPGLEWHQVLRGLWSGRRSRVL